MKYCESVHETKRWKTREVMVGKVGIGAHHPIRIQSMTTSNTRDAQATADQIMKLADVGCDIARVTVQGIKEAESCEQIKNILEKKHYTIPIVADIHFFPAAAMRVVDFVDKVRVNPGNYIDKRASFKTIEYDDFSYAKELEKIHEKFSPLVLKCRHLGKAMRIGTNHGSLSDRIMNRYGDTPIGMVMSALEFAEICRSHDFHQFVFSMKSSNPQVMILAYRLLASKMRELGWNYPLHLGVTEAGEGEDGRIKSSMGIGALLLDGLGDTIRVSLTEDPWNEIDPCRRLVQFAQGYEGKGISFFEESHRNFASIVKREVTYSSSVGLHKQGSVALFARDQDKESDFGLELQKNKQFKPTVNSADVVIFSSVARQDSLKAHLKDCGITTVSSISQNDCWTLSSLKSLSEEPIQNRFSDLVVVRRPLIIEVTDEDTASWDLLKHKTPDLIFLAPRLYKVHYARSFFEWLCKNNITAPVILKFSYDVSKENFMIHAAAELGALLCDGLGEGVCVEAPYETEFLRIFSFNVLQAARMRMTKTDFISCPSCGRTLFDLQEVTRRIKERTAHLAGVKIAIMGCIVNGPGEMADADFGYVGSRPGKIDLYVGKECVEKDIDFAQGDERLVDLIKRHGRWVEPV